MIRPCFRASTSFSVISSSLFFNISPSLSEAQQITMGIAFVTIPLLNDDILLLSDVKSQE
jgi:hypothetical protein